jgi:hypothetical protein
MSTLSATLTPTLRAGLSAAATGAASGISTARMRQALLFGLGTMATKVPGSFYRRFVDDGTAPDFVKAVDNKRELILQGLCFGIGMGMDLFVTPRVKKAFPLMHGNPMFKAAMMVPCLFMAEGVSRLMAGQKKNLYRDLYLAGAQQQTTTIQTSSSATTTTKGAFEHKIPPQLAFSHRPEGTMLPSTVATAPLQHAFNPFVNANVASAAPFRPVASAV